MYDVIIIGAGIAGLNTARLLNNNNRKICILEKTNRIGGMLHSKFINITKKNKHKSNAKKNKTLKNKFSKKKVKFETGGAVVYSYQKNMTQLIDKFNIDVFKLPVDKNGKHRKDFWDDNTKKPLSKSHQNKYYSLLKKIFRYMDKKGTSYCNKFTFEQIALQIVSLDDVRFIENCYGYSCEIRLTNSILARTNIENELFNSKNILIFKKGYNQLTNAIYNSIKNDIKLIKNCTVNKFKKYNNYYKVYTNKSSFKTKKLIFAIPKEALEKLCNSFTPDELRLFNNVQGVSLNRIFAQYDMSKKQNQWMKKLNFTTINNPIRQIIPLRKKLGLFQISYSDWYFADFWGNLSKNDTKIVLNKLLKDTFNHTIDNPIKIWKYYWKDATHAWNPNIDYKKLYKKILHLRKNLFIVGESFSLIQGWCSGAVQTSVDVAKIIN